MEHTAQQWAALQLEIELLREENKNLKLEIEDLKSSRQYEGEFNLIRSTIMPNYIKKSNSREQPPYCRHCNPLEKTKEELVNQFQSWSEKLSITLFKKKDSEVRKSISSENKESPLKQGKEEVEGLIEKICLFGPKEESSVEMNNKKIHVPHQLYFPKNDPLFSLYESYGCSLYPEAVEVKVIREKNKSIQVDKIIFRKSLKPTDCKLVIFQSQKDGEFCLPINQLKRRLNPFSIVYCVSIDFTDYLFSDRPYHGLIDKTMSLSEERADELQIQLSKEKATNSPTKISVPSLIRRDSSVYGETSLFKSNFCISVMSYYPFINFFTQFLLELINQIKIKRIQQNSKNPSHWEKIDIKYIVSELEEEVKKVQSLFLQEIDQSTKFTYQLGSSKLTFGENGLKEQMYRDWAYRMLRLLDKDILYQIFSLIMQEQSVCFFSESSYILNFMIYLFVGLLIHPFSYPFTIVSSIFELDHLETPFIAVMGLNKPLQWLHNNEEEFMTKISGKVLVILQQDEIKIKNKKKQKAQKSDRLKKIFGSFYKKIEKLDSFSKKKDILTKEITKSQNDLVLQLLTDIETYFQDQLFRYLPNVEIINSMRDQEAISNSNSSTVTAKMINKISQYVNELRRNIQRDPFVDMLMQRQIFSVFLTIKYDIV